jgi:hypothetical protein
MNGWRFFNNDSRISESFTGHLRDLASGASAVVWYSNRYREQKKG